jgi:hypothetical protein
MAHVIAHSAKGPRGDGKGGDNSYTNLILLCPTDHRHVDKAPDGEFPAELLHDWKATHEARIRSLGSEQQHETIGTLAKAVRSLLAKNHAAWKSLGPTSDAASNDPSSNVHAIWELRRADTVVPNNRAIMNLINANESLLNEKQIAAFAEFCIHADAYEVHVQNPIDAYPIFPKSFEEAFANDQ